MTVKKITGGIAKAIINEFGKDTVVYSEEVKQGFVYPCFSISLLKSSGEKGIGGRKKYINSYVVRYFPGEILKNEDMNFVTKKLLNCLELIDAGRILRGTKIRAEKGSAFNLNGISSEHENGEGILNVYVNYDYHEISLETNEMMKKLKQCL